MRPARPGWRWPSLACGLLLPVLLGCTNVRMLYPRELVQTAYTQEHLREELGDFASHFQLVVGSTADTIAERATSREIKRTALLWRLRVVPLVQEAAFEPNPQEAYISTLTLIVLIRRYVTEGEAGTLFGDQQHLVIRASDDLEKELIQIGVRFMGAAEMERVRAEIEEFARRRPVPGREFAIQSVGKALAEVEQTNVFGRVAAIPLSPFRALGGVGDSPTAIREFTVTARDFVRVIERLPEQVRWQLELLLYDVEDRETVTESVAVMQSLARSAQDVSEAASRLPADLQSVLVDSGETLGQLERLLREARELAGPLSASARSLELASESWATVLDGGEAPEAPPSEPFDIRDWESAAREIGAAAGRLSELAVELRQLSTVSAELPQIGSAVGLADDAARGWIDRAAWRLLQLLGAFFVLLLAYRWIASRLTRGRDG
jgi:hypothetical protein